MVTLALAHVDSPVRVVSKIVADGVGCLLRSVHSIYLPRGVCVLHVLATDYISRTGRTHRCILSYTDWTLGTTDEFAAKLAEYGQLSSTNVRRAHEHEFYCHLVCSLKNAGFQ